MEHFKMLPSGNPTTKGIKKMTKANKIKNVDAQTEANENNVTTENAAQAMAAPVAEKVELTNEEKRAQFVEQLRQKLRSKPSTLSIRELIAYRQYGLETWLDGQRTPSHTPNKALEIIDSALNGISCGVITLGINTEDGTVSTINGSSRIDDFIKYYTSAIGKKDAGFKELPVETAKKFLSFPLSVVWLEGTKKELIRDFKNLNNDVSLTGGQKAFTNLVGSDAMSIVSKLNKHSIFQSMFSARQLQKEEQNNCIFLVLANILDCYNAKIDTVTASLAERDMSAIDVEKLLYIMDKIESADVELNKFKFIHLVHLMYEGKCQKSKNCSYTFNVDEMDETAIGNAVSVNYATSGTNSAEVNTKRIEAMSKKMYLHFVSIGATASRAATVASDTLDPDTL